MTDKILEIAQAHKISDAGMDVRPPTKIDDDVREQAAIALRYLETAPKVPTRAGAINSYVLKHRIEEAAAVYISNGAVIIAAHMMGLKVWPCGDWNAKIGVSKRHQFTIAPAVADIRQPTLGEMMCRARGWTPQH